MIDIHSHILYGIDDGAKDIEESIEILKEASQKGVTDIILTPHYIKDSVYSCNNQEKRKLLKNLKDAIKKEKIDINLYLGNEVYIDDDIIELLKKDITTLAKSNYLLLELSLNNKPVNLNEVLYSMQSNNITPIIAHPERYTAYYKDYKFFETLIKEGCLLQVNTGSFFGVYGRRARRMAKGLLKRNMITFLGTDTHHKTDGIYSKDIRAYLLKVTKDEKKTDDLLYNNALKIIKK